jgi:hypothetical protein
MTTRARSLPRTAALALTLALAFALALVPQHAAALGDPLSETEISMIETRARGDFYASALDEGLEGEAVDLVFRIERSTAPILGLASTSCPIRVDIDNITSDPMYGVHFDVSQGFTRDGVPLTGLGGEGVSRIEIPFVPPRSRVRARVECTEPPAFLAWESSYASPVTRSVEFPTFAEAYGLEGEGITSMSFGSAAFQREYDTFIPGTSLHPLLWHVIDLSDAGPSFDRLVDTLLASPDGRRVVFQYLADAPGSLQGLAIASALSQLPASQVQTVYSGLPVDVAGRALAMLDERSFARTARALRATPEGRAAILSLLSVTDDAAQFASVAAEIDDATIEAAIIALAAGSYLETERTTLFDQLIVRARALPADRQSALAVALFTRWADHQIPSLALESRVLAVRDMARPEIDALLRTRAAALDDVFVPGSLPVELDAMELYEMIYRDLSGCSSSMERLAACADLIDGDAALATVASTGLRPDFLLRAQGVMAANVTAETAALAHRYQAWGMAVGPIAESACSGGGYYGYQSDETLAWAREIDPQAECVLAIDRREAAEANVRMMRMVFGVLLFGATLLGAWLFGRRGLRHVASIRREDAKTQQVEEGGRVAARIAREPFALALGRGLRGSEKAIREEGGPESEAVVSALAALRPHEAALTDAAQAAVQEVIARGKLRSTILELGGQSVYLVVVPGMHDQPQAFRRYAAFAHGWLAHVDRLKAMLARSELPSKLLCLFLFVRPDGSETALLVGYEDGATRYLPFGLLDEEEVHAGAGRQGTHREQWTQAEGSV